LNEVGGAIGRCDESKLMEYMGEVDLEVVDGMECSTTAEETPCIV